MTLWRTERPRFQLYMSDGYGRDRYIGYNNGGFWKNNEYTIQKKPDLDYARYTNFHTLYHQASPFKYYSDGTGRDQYVFANGLSHDDKPLASFRLTDFLRSSYEGRTFRRHGYLSQAEKNFNRQKKMLERRMIKRLYTDPLKKILEKKKMTEEKEKEDGNTDIPLRDESGTFNVYNKVYDGNEIVENDNDIDNAIFKSQKVEKYELQDEKNLLHKNLDNQNLRTHFNITGRYSLDAQPRKNRKIKFSKLKIDV